MARYNLTADSIHERFLKSQSKVQIFGGGFGNGKTAVSCIKALAIANAYPGSSGLIARSTLPKLNDTIRKEFVKWCPEAWIKSFPRGNDRVSSTCVLKNGSEINFRYIAQQGKGSGESTTSNLLSATYDWIIVDQIEDPEISYKDFLDLLGRLRGQTPRAGGMQFIDERDLPSTGPRWFIVTSNPTRGWVYKKLVKPLHDFMKYGTVSELLLIERDANGIPIINDKTGEVKPIIELFEGSTYENEDNLPDDFISTLASTYTGSMRSRFLMGNWDGYEGLVYPEVSLDTHGLPRSVMIQYKQELSRYYRVPVKESFDYGMAVPSCFLHGFVDHMGNVFVLDGFHEKERTVEQLSESITETRLRYETSKRRFEAILADPAVFRRSPSGEKNVVGKSIAKMFQEKGIKMDRGTNDIVNGITKMKGYTLIKPNHEHPITGEFGAPHLFIANELDWWWTEVEDYYWKKDSATGEPLDVPNDRNDHAMDSTKYLLSKSPEIKDLKENLSIVSFRAKWQERDDEEESLTAHRHRG